MKWVISFFVALIVLDIVELAKKEQKKIEGTQ